MRTTPPFRADQVGSLLRPAELREARARAKAGAISGEQLQRGGGSLHPRVGDPAGSAGTARRHRRRVPARLLAPRFSRRLDGVGLAPSRRGLPGRGRAAHPHGYRSGALCRSDHGGPLRFWSAAKAVPKFTIPAPAMLHLRGGRSAISREHYPDLAGFWADAAAAYRTAIGHLAAAGCTYLQLDDVSFSYLCDPKIRESLRANGDDPATLPGVYAGAINGARPGALPGWR